MLHPLTKQFLSKETEISNYHEHLFKASFSERDTEINKTCKNIFTFTLMINIF